MAKTDITPFIPRRIARSRNLKRKSISLHGDDYAQLVSFAKRVNLSVPVAIMTLLNVAENAGVE